MQFLERLFHVMGKIWSFELLTLDGYPLSVGMIIIGLTFLVLGYRVTRWVVGVIDRRFLQTLQADDSVRYLLRRGIYYFLLAMVVLTTLRVLHIPITAFAFIGGALAIGFGFGSQNIMNNFISGLILMIERPVRVGDFIDVNGAKGTVEVIGIRATHLKTVEGREVILPNSYFLEKPVTNWTLSDDLLRSEIAVGVAYGSSTFKVRDLLLKACDTNPWILKNPNPRVFFSDFGDNALLFKLNFWSHLRAEKLTDEVESDVRFTIEDQFRKSEISMPFPQRDVHIRGEGPLKVEIANRV